MQWRATIDGGGVEGDASGILVGAGWP